MDEEEILKEYNIFENEILQKELEKTGIPKIEEEDKLKTINIPKNEIIIVKEEEEENIKEKKEVLN
jgi:hypothetical protein